MITVTREFADRVADVAQLLAGDEVPDEALHRLTALEAGLVPGGTAAAVTIAMPSGALTFAASDQRLGELQRLQLDSGEGPVVETLRHNEPRRVDDTTAEHRWPPFCRAAAEAGFASCLVLPLRTDRQPVGAVALYGEEPNVFRGAAHDIALLVAAQGGTAVHNAGLYGTCRRMVDNLHAALESRAVIEQAKGILHAELGVSPAEAFRLLSRHSQNTNQRVRKISAELVWGQISAEEFRSPPGPGGGHGPESPSSPCPGQPTE
jgi:GAF domain-containing protein